MTLCVCMCGCVRVFMCVYVRACVRRCVLREDHDPEIPQMDRSQRVTNLHTPFRSKVI